MDNRILKFGVSIKEDTTVNQDLKEAFFGFILDAQDDEKKAYAFNHLLDKIFGEGVTDFNFNALDTFDHVNILDMYEEFLTKTENSEM